MQTTVEIASRSIRLCQVQDQRVTNLETYPIGADLDPIEVLKSVPLPSGLGKVRVVMHHEDMLIRALVQPLGDADRVERLVRFELGNTAGGEPVVFSWQRLTIPSPTDDVRLLAAVARVRLLERLRDALKVHDATLVSLQHPAVAVFQAWRAAGQDLKGTCLLADVGGQQVHLAVVHDGNLIFVRSQSPGLDDLVRQVAEKRGIPIADATTLVSQLGQNLPPDLLELVRRQAAAVAAAMAANVRYARTQLQCDDLEPTVIWLCGSGARVHGFIPALKEQMHLPVRIMNPFAGAPLSMPGERLDRLASLPSSWSPVLGGAQPDEVVLDVLEDERRDRARKFATVGVLRLALMAVAALLVIGISVQELAIWRADNVRQDLMGETDKPGMVAKADVLAKDVAQLAAGIAQAAERVAWLGRERRPGRIASELLVAVDAARDADSCPVVIQSYKLTPLPAGPPEKNLPAGVRIDLEGYAQSAAKRSSNEVMRAFEQALVKGYPPITAVSQIPKPIVTSRQQFRLIITVADRPLVERSREALPIGGKPGLKLAVTAPAGVTDVPGLEGVARAAALRARNGEATVEVHVVPAGGNEADGRDVKLAFKD